MYKTLYINYIYKVAGNYTYKEYSGVDIELSLQSADWSYKAVWMLLEDKKLNI